MTDRSRGTVVHETLIVTVPRNTRIIDEGGALFGKRSVAGGLDDGAEDGPLIRITGRARFGKVVVYRKGDNRWSWSGTCAEGR